MVQRCQSCCQRGEGSGLDFAFGAAHVFFHIRRDVIEIKRLVDPGQIRDRFQHALSHVLVIGVVTDIFVEVRIRNIDPDVGGCATLAAELLERRSGGRLPCRY